MANELRVSIAVDSSGLTSGLEDAQASVASAASNMADVTVASAEQMSAAMDAVKVATTNLADAQTKLGAAAAAGSEQAAAVISEYQSALSAADATVQEMRAAQAAATQATNAATAATSANTAAQRANAVATEVSAASQVNLRAAMQGSTLSMGVATGSAFRMERGLASLAARSSTLGPILEAAMPLAAFAAAAYLAVDMGEAIYKAFDIGGQAAKSITKDTLDLSRAFDESIAKTELQTLKLEDETARIEKKPTQNGLKIALLEAQEQADELAHHLDGLADKEAEVLKKMSGTTFQNILGTAPGLGKESAMNLDHSINIAKAKTMQDQLNESQRSYADAKQHVADVETKITQQQVVQSTLGPTIAAFTQQTATQLQKELAASQMIVEDRRKEIELDQASIAKAGAEQAKGAAQDARGVKGPKGPDQDVARLREIEEAWGKVRSARIDATGVPPGANEELAFYSQYVVRLKDGTLAAVGFAKQTQQAVTVLNDFAKAQQSVHAEVFKDALKANPATALAGNEAERAARTAAVTKVTEEDTKALNANAKAMASAAKIQKEAGEDLTRTGERWKEYNTEVTKGEEIAVKNAHSLQAQQDALDVARGRLTQQEAAVRAAARQVQEYNAELVILKKRLDEISSDPALTAVQKATQSQGVQNQVSQVQGQKATAQAAGQNASAEAIVDPYLKAFNSVDSAWQKVQRDIINGNTNIKKDFVQMGVSIVQSMAGAAAKALANQVRFYIMDKAAHAAASTAKTATVVTSEGAQTAAVAASQSSQTAVVAGAQAAQTGAVVIAQSSQLATVAASTATQTAIQKTASAESRLDDAKTAAANVYAQVSAIPIVGPVLAPIAAGVAFAAVEAFEAGGIVQGANGAAVPIVAHAGERVLSAPQTQKFDQMVNSSAGGAGGSPTLNYSPTIHAYDRAGMDATLQAHAAQIHSIVRSGYKQGALTG